MSKRPEGVTEIILNLREANRVYDTNPLDVAQYVLEGHANIPGILAIFNAMKAKYPSLTPNPYDFINGASVIDKLKDYLNLELPNLGYAVLVITGDEHIPTQPLIYMKISCVTDKRHSITVNDVFKITFTSIIRQQVTLLSTLSANDKQLVEALMTTSALLDEWDKLNNPKINVNNLDELELKRLDILKASLARGDVYARHFKGNAYRILCLAVDTNNLQTDVVYTDGVTIWTRKVKDFLARINPKCELKYPTASDDFRFNLDFELLASGGFQKFYALERDYEIRKEVLLNEQR